MGKFNNKKKSNKGNGNDASSSSRSGYQKSKSKEMKFSPLDSKSKYAMVPYSTVKEALVNEIKVTGMKGAAEVAKSIEDEKKVEIPDPHR